MAAENGSADAWAAKPTHLEPSELGTKEYWDDLYSREITNHASNPTDTGTNWFDDSGAQDKVLEFLASHFAQPPHEIRSARRETSFLDLGTGNGELLFGLREEGWSGRMLGVDYSERSVEFAKRINDTRQEQFSADAEQAEEEPAAEEEQDGDDEEPAPSREPVEFAQHDILSPPSADAAVLSGAQSHGWDVVLDKGTFDAISLSSATDGQGRRINEGYRAAALRLVRDGGLFLITSCNWTEDELERWFAGKSEQERDGDQARFEVADRIHYRSFSFGGVKGQTISSVCFTKIGS
ncbi:putative Protein-lysine N-methyltransferase EFM4 [Seiridium unicorne]|uniref:Protein-lysine N-methyltransferase EFM4 n=1 Tax=Seiridium unicorne TaxID=138068 RepID=A0ABR2VFV9_9PEZI